MKVITDRATIEMQLSKFLIEAKTACTRHGSAWVGWRGGNIDLTVYWFDKLSFWFGLKSDLTENRHWMAFGLGEPDWSKKTTMSIVCEVNVPFEGVYRNIQGALLKEDDVQGNKIRIHLVHRGRLGGGRPGVGSSFGSDFWGGSLVKARCRDSVDIFVPVACIEDERQWLTTGLFVREAAAYKGLVTEAQNEA